MNAIDPCDLEFRVSPGRLPAALACVAARRRTAAPAQPATATLFVEVRDGDGGALPAAVVTVTNQDNGIGRTGISSDAGVLVVPLLPAGAYTLTVALDGFKTEVVRDIRAAGVAQGHHHRHAHARMPSPSTSSSPPTGRCCALGTRRSARSSTTDAGDAAGHRARRAAAHDPCAGRGAARAGLAPVHPGQRRPQQRRRPRGREQLPARRRRQQRPVPQSPGGEPQPRCHRGGVAAAEHLRRRVRAQRGRTGERHPQIRHPQPPRHHLRVLPRRRARRTQPARAHGYAQGGAAQAPVRRDRWRADRPAALVLLRQRRSRAGPRGRNAAGARPDTGRAGRRLQPERCAHRRPLHRTALCRQPGAGLALQRRRPGDGRPLSAAQPRRRQRQLRRLARGRAAGHPVDGQDRPPRLARQPDRRALYVQPRRPRPALSRPTGAISPASVCRCSIRGTTSRPASRNRSDRASSTRSVSGSTPCAGRTCRNDPASTALPRLASSGRRSTRSIAPIPPW